nr:hypothetical protein MACL_00001015 [Theileria orientalis]
MSPKIFTYVFYDSFYIASALEYVEHFVQFLGNFIYGVYLMSKHVKANLWALYLAGALFLFFMVVIEIFNAVIYKFILYVRDYKVTKYNDILGSLSIIKKMLIDDIGFNIITRTRNDELSLVFVKNFITLLNMCIYSTWINTSFYIIKRYFVKSVNDVNVISDIDTAGFMTTFYIYMKIVGSMFLIPRAINVFGMGYASYRRLNKYLSGCSPNFYAADNKFTGSTKTSYNIIELTTQLPKDIVVYYKDASFTWVHTRDDLLNKNYDIFLKDVNFVLKRGDIAIITGSQGSGKSNFIKTMLGEMTLVGGSMAVVPLHTSMPIFYASQDIFLQQGTIRSNIVFGYKFDEQLYNTVLKAVELQSDISTWEKGDLRVVSDNAHTLSGGQRVRVELARAIYAYLVFHKVNKEYNNSKCSFLMCLDASFQCLDPYVIKIMFNNLFNVKTGLLVKDDLSLVLTASKQSLQTCMNPSDSNQFPNVPIYNIKTKELKFFSNLHDFMKNNKHDGDFNFSTFAKPGPYTLNSLNNNMLGICLSSANSKCGRAEVNKEIYRESFKTYVKDHLAGIKFNPYFVYMKPALFTFSMYIILTVALSAMDYGKFILSTNLSDYIINNINEYDKGNYVDLDKVKTHTNSALGVTVMFVSIIIILSFLATVAISVGSLISCRKLHEYCIKTMFNYSSSLVKIKKQISQVLTFISCDLMMIDDITGLFFALLLFSFIQTVTNIITLFYVIPFSIPFIAVTIILTYVYVLRRYIGSVSTLNFGFFESLAHLNTVIERTILGSPVYRSFNRNSDLIRDFLEQRDYNARTKFLFAAVVSWSTVVFTWMFSITTFIILVIPIVLDKYSKYKMTVGYFGLALSLCTNVIKSYSNFALIYACVQMLMGSIERFQYFIPLGQKLTFDPCPNTHEEYVVNQSDKKVSFLDKKQLLKRRSIEFRAENKKFYRLRKFFYHPRIHFLDVDRYLSSDHSGIKLQNVCIYASLDRNSDNMILKHLSVSAHKSEIIGVIGKTGAGKTTLLSALQNINENRTGHVVLDGKDLNDLPKVVLRQVIGVVPQLPFLFKGWTIRRFLDPRNLFPDHEIYEALDKCSFLDFVNTLPGSKGLDTVIIPDGDLIDSHSDTNQSKNRSENENNYIELNKHYFGNCKLLSSTQIRTLMFARLVLYNDFYRMIVVDEPPQEDLAEEKRAKSDDQGIEIYNLLRKYFGHCTTFVTAHDVKVLKTCTSVWVIHEGSLVKTCKASDIAANESIASIIEECVKYS